VTGNVSYDPMNHEKMVHLRPRRWRGSPTDIPDLEVVGDATGRAELVLGWGSTAGAITGAVNVAQREGLPVSRAHLRYLNPFPKNLGEVATALRPCAPPGDEPGPARPAPPRPVSQGRHHVQQGAGPGPSPGRRFYNKIREILEPVSHVN